MQRLTERERQIVDLISRGHSNRDVASHLGITHGTVKVHMNNIYAKLEIGNRVMLAIAWLHDTRELGEVK